MFTIGQLLIQYFFLQLSKLNKVQKHAYLLTKVHVLPFVAARFLTTV